jgi:hypothetical protein
MSRYEDVVVVVLTQSERPGHASRILHHVGAYNCIYEDRVGQLLNMQMQRPPSHTQVLIQLSMAPIKAVHSPLLYIILSLCLRGLPPVTPRLQQRRLRAIENGRLLYIQTLPDQGIPYAVSEMEGNGVTSAFKTCPSFHPWAVRVSFSFKMRPR